jgi:hypothetical protein
MKQNVDEKMRRRTFVSNVNDVECRRRWELMANDFPS